MNYGAYFCKLVRERIFVIKACQGNDFAINKKQK